MIRKIFGSKQRKHAGIRWRAHDIYRIEALSDAVFAFAVTLLVVSLEVPKTFHELYASLFPGIIGFAIGFLFLMLIRHDHYLFFRMYGLKDTTTIFWTCVLLFVVLFYIYPTKFLFTLMFSGTGIIEEHGVMVKMIESADEWRKLMMLYGFGFSMVYFTLWQLYHHAFKMREHLKLTPVEVFLTKSSEFHQLAMCAIGCLSFGLAYFLPPEKCGNAGMIFMLIWPVLTILHTIRRKQLNSKFSAEEILKHTEHLNEKP
ncbi:MAG: TMEM175 family protein [Bacteroidia bacterium]